MTDLQKRLVQAYLHADPDVEGLLNALLGLLRAMSWVYQTAHWQVGGDTAYGNHLLFKRFYDGMGKEIDELAEKMVGYQGIHAVHPVRSLDFTAQWVTRWASIACPFQRGLQMEADLQDSLRKTYDALKGANVLTLGMDDWLMALANAHETNTYLLQQVLDKQHAHNTKVASGAPSEEGRFFDNPEKREVREWSQTDAISNNPEVAAEAARTEVSDETPWEAVQEAEEAPPTPEEIAKEPGGAAVSTLNRYLVETEEAVPAAVPQGYEEVPKHPVITAKWDDWTLV